MSARLGALGALGMLGMFGAALATFPARRADAQTTARGWTDYGGGPDQSKYVASTQITNRWHQAPLIIWEKSNAVSGGSPPNSDAF